jgi:hypothetical protein
MMIEKIVKLMEHPRADGKFNTGPARRAFYSSVWSVKQENTVALVTPTRDGNHAVYQAA